MNIILVRHGQDEDNARGILNGHRDMPLTQKGEDQAKAAGYQLSSSGVRVDIVLCSPLRRAKETAKIMSNILHISNPKVEPLLIERDFGILTGKPVYDIPKYSTKILKSDNVCYFLESDGAESFPMVYDRANHLLMKLKTKYKNKNKNLLLVCHGDIGKIIQAAYYGWTWEKGLRTKYFDNSNIIFLK